MQLLLQDTMIVADWKLRIMEDLYFLAWMLLLEEWTYSRLLHRYLRYLGMHDRGPCFTLPTLGENYLTGQQAIPSTSCGDSAHRLVPQS